MTTATKIHVDLCQILSTIITKESEEPNNRVLLEVYRLVVLFLLLYIICASVLTEGTDFVWTWISVHSLDTKCINSRLK